MSQLRQRAAIPRDSFLSVGTNYRQRIFPIGPAPIAISPEQSDQEDDLQQDATQVSVVETTESVDPEQTQVAPKSSQDSLKVKASGQGPRSRVQGPEEDRQDPEGFADIDHQHKAT